MHVKAYKNYLEYLGITKPSYEVMFVRDQSALVHDDVAELFHTDIRGIFPDSMRPGTWDKERWVDGEYEYALDEWNTRWRREKGGGLYFDMVEHPLREEEISAADVERYPWPNPSDNEDFAKMGERARYLYSTYGCAIFLENPLATIFDAPSRLRGHDYFYMDFLLRPDVAEALMDGMLRLQLEYYEKALAALEGLPIFVRTSDDIATERALTISPDTYRSMVKPRHKALFDGIRAAARGDVWIFFHCDGTIRDVIPDFIEIGADCLNPIEDHCPGMDLGELKREFGRDITFWGAGVNTPGVLRTGTPRQVVEDVRRRVEILAPGGGFVFSTIHNVQPDVPPENIEALWRTVGEYR